MSTFGDEIRKGRKAAGWTQRQLAEVLGVSKGLVAQWEGSSAKPPGRENLIQAARVLRLPVAQLLGEPALEDGAVSVSDPSEVALLELYRKLSPKQRGICLDLLYEWVGDDKPIEKSDYPAGRKGIAG